MKLRSEIFVSGRRIADDEPVYIVGEMACGHQGDLSQAFALVDAAVKAEADCIQIQIFETAANMTPTSPLYAVLEKLYFSPYEWYQLVKYVRQFDIHLSIFAYDEPSLELAVDLEPDMLKLNSSELSNPQMLIGAGKSRLPLTLGTGASSIEEIRRGVREVLESGGENLILMHGVQNFPTPIEEANLQKIRLLKDEFKCLIIYADHTDANSDLSHWIDLLAIGQGAALLEKHLVLDRTRKGVDWEAALEPDEFSRYVAAMKKGSHALGPYKFQPFSDGELRYRRFQKKSLVAARNMEAGHEIEPEDIQYLRVQGENEGITPYQFEKEMFGRKLARSVTQFSQLHLNDFVKGD